MDFTELYAQKKMTADQAAALVKSGDWVDYGWAVNTPVAVDAAIAKRLPELEDVNFRGGILMWVPAIFQIEDPAAHMTWNSWHMGGIERKAIAQGFSFYSPIRYSELPRYYRDSSDPVDVAVFQVTPMDEHGWFNFGPGGSHLKAVCECAKTVIAQVNKAMPYSYGDAVIHVSRLAAAVEVDSPLVEVPTAVPSETERKIGSYIAELIPDGATLQIGVGGIPNAVLAALTGHKHLGLHTEAMTDGVLPLLESGVIDNSQKAVMPGVTVASLALGSRRLYDYMDYRKDLVMKDVAWTNDPFRIRQNPKVMAINSAVEVDLTGQVCADSVGMRIISGVGGQHDFMYGGALSEGGKTFIAIPSTTPKGESKIRALLSPGAGVVTTRHMVQHVVTEYGVAHLRGRNLAERARALIAVAHPSVREELERAAAERFGYSFLRLKA